MYVRVCVRVHAKLSMAHMAVDLEKVSTLLSLVDMLVVPSRVYNVKGGYQTTLYPEPLD